MKTKIILLLIISTLIIGCIEKQSVSSNSISSKIFITETFDDIAAKFEECGSTMTTAQCDDWVENHINGKYVMWNGTVDDVKDNAVIVYMLFFSSKQNRYENDKILEKYTSMNKTYKPDFRKYKRIYLYNISKQEILKLRPNEKINFSGKLLNFNCYTRVGCHKSWIYDGWWMNEWWGDINLYDVNILNKSDE